MTTNAFKVSKFAHKLGICLSLLLLYSQGAVAQIGGDELNCTVERASQLRGDGQLARTLRPATIYEPFTVDTDSGDIDGGPFDSAGMSVSADAQTTGAGSLTITGASLGASPRTFYLLIQDTEREGDKPFVGISSTNALVVSGLCR